MLDGNDIFTTHMNCKNERLLKNNYILLFI